jgi:hypothetical protein
MHTHVTIQLPIYDAFGYYEKADNFWTALRGRTWFNPLNIEPTFRPPGTIFMSYPFGFTVNPRPFYFRSIYLPILLLFLAILIVAYDRKSDARIRWRIVLTAMCFTSMTLAYHFEFGSWGRLYWGLVDSFLTGLAAVGAACAWRGTRHTANILVWAIATCLISVLAIVVKPSGALVASVIALAWGAFGLATLIEHRQSPTWQKTVELRLIVKLTLGAFTIGIGDASIVAASMRSGYLSPQNFAYGQGAIELMRQIHLPIAELWMVMNAALGRGLIYWTCLAALICATALLSPSRSILTVRHITAILVCIATLLFGIWFWFIGSGASTQVRYGVPFFIMGLVWLTPTTQLAWDIAPTMVRRVTTAVMLATVLNLILLLLVQRPALAWQEFSGVGITADFSAVVSNALKAFVSENSDHPRSIYVISFDSNDAVLDSIIDNGQLFHPNRQPLTLRRPIDWQRSATVRIKEVETANALLVNPQQCTQTFKQVAVANLKDEQDEFTCWADGLSIKDGVIELLSTPTAKLFSIVNSARLHVSLKTFVATHKWDAFFNTANRGQG